MSNPTSDCLDHQLHLHDVRPWQDSIKGYVIEFKLKHLSNTCISQWLLLTSLHSKVMKTQSLCRPNTTQTASLSKTSLDPSRLATASFPNQLIPPIMASISIVCNRSALRIPSSLIRVIALIVYYMQTDDFETKYARELHERVRREFPEVCLSFYIIDPAWGLLILVSSLS